MRFLYPAGNLAPVELTFKVVYSNDKRRYVLQQTIIGALTGETEITGQLIRSIQFQDILQRGLNELKYIDLHTLELSKIRAIDYRPNNRNELIHRGPDAESLQTVALLYRIAEVLNANQGKHVENALEIPYPTAANWISRARKQGAFEAIEKISKVFPSVDFLQEIDVPGY